MNMRTTKKRGRLRVLGLVWAAACLAGTSGLLAGPASAVSHAEPLSAGSGSGVSRSDYSISGDYVVWLNTDGNGQKQIYVQNASTGEQTAVTNRNVPKDVPAINGSTIVWADKGEQGLASADWDIYSYNLRTGAELKLNRTDGPYANPTVDGNGVVWSDTRQYGNMIYHDLKTGAEANLGEGRYPVLMNGRVVYLNARDGGLSVLELDSGINRSLVALGGSNYVDWFVTNGEHMLFKQKNGDLESKYAIISLDDQLAPVQDLTEMSVKNEEYAFMSIGDTKAAFLINEGGQTVLKGVSLDTAKVYDLTGNDPGKKYIGFSGDRLIYTYTDGSLGYVALGGSSTEPGTGGGGQGSNPSPSTSSPSSSGGSANKGNAAAPSVTKIVVGVEGGTVGSADGRAQLVIVPGTFTEDTEISLTELDGNDFTLTDEKGRTLEAAGAVWRIQAAADFGKEAELSLAYGDEDYCEQLGIYQYDEAAGYWTYVGGITDNAEGRYVRTDISSSGIYAVLLRNVAFDDVASNHWASNEIGVLAARGIVDGVGADAFAPKDTLMRAQFSKMLAGALGIKPVSPAEPTFKDVAASKWSYGWVEAAAAAGIAEGDQGSFRPDDALTREQMMAMLVRAIDVKVEDEAAAVKEAGLSRFKDATEVSEWAKPLVVLPERHAERPARPVERRRRSRLALPLRRIRHSEDPEKFDLNYPGPDNMFGLHRIRL
ncbi:S-layer homology domain-containing protein [Paenibacillus sp. M1]|uniref:S-layer homology domain-containing protein n=1 Tax=Paenibacillus haidiansis TaxID=1574488 RepID=A0ABU7VPC7_9BACL